MLVRKLLGSVALSLLVAGVAVAQQAPNLLIPSENAPAPVNGNQQVLNNAGVAPVAVKPVTVPKAAAPMPVQPTGGFETAPPAVGAEDPATRMTLDGSADYTNQLTGQANTRLEDLTGATVSAETASDLELMMNLKRNNMLLGLKNEEAELAVSLWGTLYNNEHAQAWRQREEAQAAERKKAEEDATAARLATLAAQSKAPAVTSLPVVYEVNNGRAILLMAGSGEIYAQSGTILPNGMKVVSVGGGGVVVEHNGNRVNLAFGTQVSQ